MSVANADSARWLDGVAIAGSVACAVHCLVFPLTIALLPALSRSLEVSENFHLWLLLFALPFSTLVLWRHSLRRGRREPFLLGMSGLAIMAAALALEGQVLEPIVTGVGALLLAGAHILNWRGRMSCRG